MVRVLDQVLMSFRFAAAREHGGKAVPRAVIDGSLDLLGLLRATISLLFAVLQSAMVTSGE